MPDGNQNSNLGGMAPEPVFFNVMPKIRLKSPPIIESKTTASNNQPARASAQAGGNAQTRTFSSKKILLIVLGLLLFLGLAAGAYYAFMGDNYAGDVPPPPPALSEELPPAPPEEPPPPAPITVTTPAEWQQQWFGAGECVTENCGDSADPDNDGLSNLEEHTAKTDPTKNDTDGDGLSDGDEVHVFGGSPINMRTAGNKKYTDADDAKGGYDSTKKGAKFTEERLAQLIQLGKQYGFHEPTQTTLGATISQYQANELEIDNSLEGQLDRDTQRSTTIKKIGVALQKYFDDRSYYPATNSFSEMVAEIKPYNMVATNPSDPINSPPYVYTYAVAQNGTDFTITYFSETQKQVIKYTSINARRDVELEQKTANDDIRIQHLENIRSALLIYSAANSGGSQEYVFPTVAKYKTELAPKYLESVPIDPLTNKDYEYKVSSTFDSFTLKAVLENPPTGKTGYLCTLDGCDNY